MTAGAGGALGAGEARPEFDAPGLNEHERTSYFLGDWFRTADSSPNLAPDPIKLDRLIAAARRDALEEAGAIAESAEPSADEAAHVPYRRGFSDAADEIAAAIRAAKERTA